MAEARHAVVVHGPGLVARNRSREAADEQVEGAVAVDVGRVGNVLAVREDGLTGHVPERVRGEHVGRGPRSAVVAVVPDVAEDLFREQVQVAVQVHVDEAKPLADDKVLVAVGLPAVLGRAAGGDVAEEHHAVGMLLDEEIEVAVAVRVGELGARQVEASQEGMVDDIPLHVPELDAVHDALPGVGVVRRRRTSRWANVAAGATAPSATGSATPEERLHTPRRRHAVPPPYPAGPIAMPAG